ncbi:hypothetical protein D0962_23205 [Leptolyngbyaceae cyanobacterium CCMR0082]|uniref:Uncharacterized protein n=1 Tax=Adonisia turfae CCMR0082 TaxID=2304604 RepID=A0A6M0SAV2_9CYAN|nr:hypothetical protein [Adonisia turfae]NEZ65628.1 hypothetical protein [Adonisia turfae CCMR0082]
MHNNLPTVTPEELPDLKRQLMTLCAIHGVAGVVEALSEVAGDFSGRQGNLFPVIETDNKTFGTSNTVLKSEWAAIWAMLSKCSDELRAIIDD